MKNQLIVFLDTDQIGFLEQDQHGTMWFRYNPDWLANANAMSLSAALPLREEPYHSRECRPFFAGLLPEESSRKRIAERFGVSERNDFAILEQIGAECAGAVALLRMDDSPPSAKTQYRKMDHGELELKLASLPQAPLLAGEEGIRSSLAGAQGKAALAIHQGVFYLPLDGSPSTHILKPESTRFPNLLENEFFCMRLATAVGLDVANVEIGQAGKIRFLQVSRYDRHYDAKSGLTRIHQEDFCQALAIAPELKYQTEDGPGLKNCFELVRNHSVTPALDVLKLFDAVIFNYLIGNNDAHGKNFSFLREAGNIRLAPLYDLVSTEIYPELTTQMAMKIGRAKTAVEISSKDWIAFFTDVGLGAAMAVQRMQKLANKVQKHISNLPVTTVSENIASLVTRRSSFILELRKTGS